MPHYPSTQRIASLRLRVGLGVGLVLGSAGLGLAGSLLFPASRSGRPGQVAWAISTERGSRSHKPDHTIYPLVAYQYVGTSAPIRQTAYVLADTGRYQSQSGLQPEPLKHSPKLRRSGPGQAHRTAKVGTMSVVQRSWRTIKLMFR